MAYAYEFDRPVFEVTEQEYSDHYSDDQTPRYMITVDERWRFYILCSDLYKDKAAWLAEVLNDHGKKPGERE